MKSQRGKSPLTFDERVDFCKLTFDEKVNLTGCRAAHARVVLGDLGDHRVLLPLDHPQTVEHVGFVAPRFWGVT